MKIFSIYNDRTSFWQWDIGQKLIVDDSVCQEVHFDNGTTESALVCAVYEQEGKRLVNVPNILLQTAATLYAYAFLEDDDGERTMCSKCFNVYPRPKPADYIYTETEIWTAEKAVADALQEAKDSGEFDGYTPQRGVDYWTAEDRAGILEEIQPTLDEAAEAAVQAKITAEDAVSIAKGRATGYVFDTQEDLDLWLMDATNTEKLVLGDNLYIRDTGVPDYWWDGQQAQPLETQKVDLTEYAKITDYASNKQAGLVRIFNSQGLQVASGTGLLSTKMATNEEITGKEHKYSVIVPSNLDYAVKSGLSNSQIGWTDAEQKRACAQIGSIMIKENSDGTITATLPSGKSKTVDLSMIEIFL